MTKATFKVLLGMIVVAFSASVAAKGSTSRITISGDNLSQPVEIRQATIVEQFQIWTGPGTRSCVGDRSNCAEGTEGFIVDWTSGAVVDRPTGLQHYDVSFFVVDDRFPGQPAPERLAYVVSYEYDPARAQGYVYLPGKSDEWFQLNTGSIYRGVEGNWFRATRSWQDAVVPLISQR